MDSGPQVRLATRTGSEFIFGDPASWGAPDVTTVTETRLHGTATARAWHRLHPRLILQRHFSCLCW
ncbi:hypothetical protein [Salinispora arenicola]|uniref:hypothetical protein n=1 Tax=Salinispora arenicola TaxID=168697 RepID=UPI0004880694